MFEFGFVGSEPSFYFAVGLGVVYSCEYVFYFVVFAEDCVKVPCLLLAGLNCVPWSVSMACALCRSGLWHL